MDAKQFRTEWLKANPNIIHIPSEHELLLMNSYAEFYYKDKMSRLDPEFIELLLNKHGPQGLHSLADKLLDIANNDISSAINHG